MSDVALYRALKWICLLSWLAFAGLLAAEWILGGFTWWLGGICMLACLLTVMVSKLKSGYY